MLTRIWGGMILTGFVWALCCGRTEAFASAAAAGADRAIQLLLGMAGAVCLWSGMMKIAEDSGLARGIAKVLSPVLSRLLPDYDKDSRAMQAVSANVTANLLGLGNAATPLGLLAMKEMQKSNSLQEEPNNSMVAFVVLNTASVQLIPTTIAALRQAAGSKAPYEILPQVWGASVLALCAGLIVCRLLSGGRTSKRKRSVRITKHIESGEA